MFMSNNTWIFLIKDDYQSCKEIGRQIDNTHGLLQAFYADAVILPLCFPHFLGHMN